MLLLFSFLFSLFSFSLSSFLFPLFSLLSSSLFSPLLSLSSLLFSLLSCRGHFHTVITVSDRSDTPSHTENHLWFYCVCCFGVGATLCRELQPYPISFRVTPVLPSLSWDLRHTHQPSCHLQALDYEPLRASMVPDRLLHAETLSNL